MVTSMNPSLRFLSDCIVRHVRAASSNLLVVLWAIRKFALELLRLALRPSVLNPVLWAIALGVTAYAASLWLLVLKH